VKPDINSVEVHPQRVMGIGHAVDGVLLSGAGSMWQSRYLVNSDIFSTKFVFLATNN
jgi:hypothetical protein